MQNAQISTQIKRRIGQRLCGAHDLCKINRTLFFTCLKGIELTVRILEIHRIADIVIGCH